MVSQIVLSITLYNFYLFILKLCSWTIPSICIIKHRQKQILKGGGNRYQHKFNYFHPVFQKIACIPPGMCTLHFEECISHCSLAEPSFSSEPRKEGFFLSWLNFTGVSQHTVMSHTFILHRGEKTHFISVSFLTPGAVLNEPFLIK